MKLESLNGEAPEEILQADGGRLTFGRDMENAIVIDSDSVSRVHAAIFDAQGSWLFRDLNSTNGSLVNGVRVQPGQLRLLRDGDLIQLATFPVRYTDVQKPSAETIAATPPTLLVFYNDNFETEFPLATPGAKFAIGGDDAHFFLSAAGEETQLEILANGSRLELHSFPGQSSVIVNGMSVGGVTNLSDRDEVDIGPYKIVINDIASARTAKQSKMIAALESGRDLGPDPASARAGKMGKAWDDDSSSKKLVSGKKFIFGSSPDEPEDIHGTLAMSRRDMAAKLGEMGAAQRFTQSAIRREAVDDGGRTENKQMILGVVVLLVILGALVYFISTL